MDLGVSSRQLDSAVRGFSFMREGPLDMRMGPSSPRTAADIVNHWPEADIVRILFEFGEESKARRIAGAIVRQRAEKPCGWIQVWSLRHRPLLLGALVEEAPAAPRVRVSVRRGELAAPVLVRSIAMFAARTKRITFAPITVDGISR